MQIRGSRMAWRDFQGLVLYDHRTPDVLVPGEGEMVGRIEISRLLPLEKEGEGLKEIHSRLWTDAISDPFDLLPGEMLSGMILTIGGPKDIDRIFPFLQGLHYGSHVGFAVIEIRGDHLFSGRADRHAVRALVRDTVGQPLPHGDRLGIAHLLAVAQDGLASDDLFDPVTETP